MRKAIIKIDLVNSTEFFSRILAGEPWTMARVHEALNELVLSVFPDVDTPAPKGTFVSSEGDAIILALDKPTTALRCAIELQKKWASMVTHIPDIRVVLDYGDVSESIDATKQTRLIGAPFTVTARMEKNFGAGEIGVSDTFRRSVDLTLVFFRKGPEIGQVPDGNVKTWKVIYENPRTLTETALAHALFIVEPESDKVRERAIEALIADTLLAEEESRALPVSEISRRLSDKGLPPLPPRGTVASIIENSAYLEWQDKDVAVTESGRALLVEQRQRLDNEKQLVVQSIVMALADKLALSNHGYFLNEKIAKTIEEFLSAVFLEIRMMANYFRSTGHMFDRLAETPEFDFVIKNNFPSVADRPEQFALFKRIFLSELRRLATANNVYIATIFHNVLLLYYLNRHDRTAVGALAKVKQKKIYLDTNALYAIQIPSMLFHEELKYATDRLRSLGAEICVFDISVAEYNQSLDAALSQYHSGRLSRNVARDSAPYIWKEYADHQSRYMNRFETCIDVYRIPRNGGRDATLKEVRTDLLERGILLQEIPQILTKEELGDLYSYVHTVKDEKARAPERLMQFGIDFFGERVAHDANCLYYLSQDEQSKPGDAKQLFITCDFFLARIRKKRKGKYDFVMTAPEFYEFMLPYLFLNDEPARNPVELPNSMFAMLIENETNRSVGLGDIFSDYLSGRADPKHYEILAEASVAHRFEEITKKHRWQAGEPGDGKAFSDEALIATTKAFSNYEREVAADAKKLIEADEIERLRTQLALLTEKGRELSAENEKLKAKIAGKERFARKGNYK